MSKNRVANATENGAGPEAAAKATVVDLTDEQRAVLQRRYVQWQHAQDREELLEAALHDLCRVLGGVGSQLVGGAGGLALVRPAETEEAEPEHAAPDDTEET